MSLISSCDNNLDVTIIFVTIVLVTIILNVTKIKVYCDKINYH